MATKKQKQQLVDTLKFTPRTYRVELGAYGGESYCGKVSRETYDFFKEHRIDLDEYASDWDEDKWDFIPEELKPFPPGSPYECDNLFHASGPSLDSGNFLTVYDENSTEVFQCELSTGALEDQGIEVNCWEKEYIDDQPDDTVVYWGGQGEKGLCFGGEIELKAPFDPKKLKVNYSDCDGWCIVNGVEYNGEDVDNNDYSTTGKWGENKWIIVGSDEEIYKGVERGEEESEDEENEESQSSDYRCTECDWTGSVDELHYNDEDSEGTCPECYSTVTSADVPVLEGEEMWAQTAIDESLYTEWYDSDVKPERKGEYEASVDAAWPMSGIIRATWTGRTWKDLDGNKVKIRSWRGLKEPAE